MRVLFPSYAFFPDQGGGPSSSIYWLSKELVKHGVDVSVIVTNRGLNGLYPSNKVVNVDGINVRYCSYLTLKFPLKVLLYSLKEVRTCDIIHFSSIYFFPNIVIGIVALIRKKKIVWSPRGELATSLNINGIKKIYLNLFSIVFSSRVIFHGTSEKEIEEIKNAIRGGKTIMLPNYMDLPNKVNCSTEKKLLYVGRINPVKALDKLIEALSLSVLFKKSDFIFVLAGAPAGSGSDVYYRELTKQIKLLDLQDKIVFLGQITGAEKNREYANAYFTFLVSYTENFGNVVIESMAQGTPVVTSLGTPWKVLREKEIGYNVSNSPQVLASVIDEVLSMSQDDYMKMREKTYRYCIDEFSVVQNIGKWITIYGEIIK